MSQKMVKYIYQLLEQYPEIGHQHCGFFKSGMFLFGPAIVKSSSVTDSKLTIAVFKDWII